MENYLRWPWLLAASAAAYFGLQYVSTRTGVPLLVCFLPLAAAGAAVAVALFVAEARRQRAQRQEAEAARRELEASDPVAAAHFRRLGRD